jgi:hypothetical protein
MSASLFLFLFIISSKWYYELRDKVVEKQIIELNDSKYECRKVIIKTEIKDADS